MKLIYIVESGIYINGIEWEFSEEYYASSKERAIEYIKATSYVDVKDFININDKYIKVTTDDFEKVYGIVIKELDEEY